MACSYKWSSIASIAWEYNSSAVNLLSSFAGSELQATNVSRIKAYKLWRMTESNKNLRDYSKDIITTPPGVILYETDIDADLDATPLADVPTSLSFKVPIEYG